MDSTWKYQSINDYNHKCCNCIYFYVYVITGFGSTSAVGYCKHPKVKYEAIYNENKIACMWWKQKNKL